MGDKAPTGRPENTYLVIPCPPDQFGRFLGGLLGKPQIIERGFSGTLRISSDDVTNFYHLVEQRVREQNEATLVQFTVRMLYDDGSSVEVASLDDFLHYSEVRPLVATGVSMTWVYLVKFISKPAPERQQIDVEIEVGTRYSSNSIIAEDVMMRTVERMTGTIVGAGRTARRYGPYDTGYVGFRISHTARSWGSDIEALLSAHIQNLIAS